MSAEDAYALLESIAKLSGTMDKLRRLTPEGHEVLDEEVAAEVQAEAKERKAPFSFFKCGIEPGAEIVLVGRSDIVATVSDDRQIKYGTDSRIPYPLLRRKYCRHLIRFKVPATGPIRGKSCAISVRKGKRKAFINSWTDEVKPWHFLISLLPATKAQ